MITTQVELRKSFWNDNPHLKRQPGKTQNDYSAVVRLAWGNYVEMMRRCGEISDALAQRATL